MAHAQSSRNLFHGLHANKKQLLAIFTITAVSIAAPPLASAYIDGSASLPFFSTSPETGSSNDTSQSSSPKHTANEQQPADSTARSSASQQSTDASVTAGESSASVTINGESIPVPANGTIHKTIPQEDGKTSVDIKVKNGSTSITSRSSSTSVTTQNGTSNVQINTHSSTSGTEDINDDIFNSRSVRPMER